MAKKGRKPSNKRKGYFFETEEEAVKQYINAQDKEEKNQIYVQYLKPAFEKMINSIIRRYHHYVPDEEYDQTFNDTLSYMLTKLNNFKPEMGYKAYSYCGTVARNYLKWKNTQYSKNLQRNLPYEEMMDDIDNDNYYETDDTTFKREAPALIRNICNEINKMTQNPEEYNLNANEVKAGLALVELLSNWEEIFVEGSNKMNKSSVLYFLREETMMTTKELRDNMKKYKAAYMLMRNIALE
jgi:hypothetical protein